MDFEKVLARADKLFSEGSHLHQSVYVWIFFWGPIKTCFAELKAIIADDKTMEDLIKGDEAGGLKQLFDLMMSDSEDLQKEAAEESKDREEL